MRVTSLNSALISKLRRANIDASFLNPYIMKAKELTGLLYTVEELKESFPDIFPHPDRPIILEIGCYKGATVIELGKFNPHLNVLGIDFRFKRVVKSCKKIKHEALDNCKIAIGAAGDIVSLLPERSIFGALVFFPDPWEKEKQRKNRMMTGPFLANIHARLQEGGFLWYKTDKEDYFDEVVALVEKGGFVKTSALPGQIARREYRSRFEDMFIEQGEPIYRVILKKESKNRSAEVSNR